MMAPFDEKPAILPPLKLQLPIRKRNAVILPPGIISCALPSPLPVLPFSLPFCPSPPPAPLVSTEEEELEWAFIDEYGEFLDISSDRSSPGDDIIEDLEERDIDSLPELLYKL